jgi:uncharacterized membrane protein (UPF0182 family)
MNNFNDRFPHGGFRPGRSAAPRRGGRPSGIIWATGLLLLFWIAGALRSIYVDWLWYESVGFEGVFRTRITTQVWLFVGSAVLAALTLVANVRAARRLSPRLNEVPFVPDLDARTIRRLGEAAIMVVVLLLSLILAGGASGAWDTVLRWQHGVSFGSADPQFGRDVGFFVFSLPAWRFLHGWLLALLVCSALVAGGVYGLAYSLQGFELIITRGMRRHLSILGGAMLLLIAFGMWLSVYELVVTPGGLAFGGMYTDINARLPVRYVLAALAALAAFAVIGSAFVTSLGSRLPAAVLVVWAIAYVGGAWIYPNAVQSLQVEPNELRREEPYIQRNVDATRQAWALDRIDVVQHPANPMVTQAEFTANPETLENIRLLDPQPLTATLNELQALRPLYRFANIDISRYPLRDGTAADQQVLISARELDLGRVADRNWTRDRLQLTHGFGAIATPVTEVQAEGLPELILRDIPPRTPYEPLALTEDGARLYFGELTDHYVVVNTSEPEFDYPDPQERGRDIRTSYAHPRGIQLSSIVRRLMLAWELRDLNLLISAQIHDDSRLLLYRQIQQRVARIAPFLLLDSDPYVAVIDGRLQWIQPAYTWTSHYPYSERTAGQINYIRNSVLVVIDSSTGDMTFYLTGADDPIVQTMGAVFPGFFTSDADMPDQVRQQLRYPLDMFRIQADLYRRYHVTEAEIFFLGEDFWQVPIQRVRGATQPMEPYYVTMRLPGEDAVEFVLILPFTPRDRENTVAWLAGRADGPHFGTMRNFRFPTGVLVFGPSQIENRIEQNATISQQLTLWDSAGSEVLRSTLMMVPIGDSFLYIQPVYLQATGGRMPELRRVIVANGNTVSMEETFDEALAVTIGTRAPSPPEADAAAAADSAPSPAAAGADTAAATELERLLGEARQAQQATQAELDRLRQLLDQIEQTIGP